MSATGDPLELPLTGIRPVEASAGTGKTFTIATLYLRLILERDLKVDEIVVATFTRAASAELSTRLRERLVIADRLLAGDTVHDPATPETQRTIEHAKTLGIEHRALARRAHDARLAIDTACIGTLHGFCQRALAEFGFETGQALRQPELVDDARALEDEIIRDFWRRGSADDAVASLLATTWGSPDALARQVRDARWRGREIEVPASDMAATEAAMTTAAVQIRGWTAGHVDEFNQELQRCVGDTRARNNRIVALQALRNWAAAANDEASFDNCDGKAVSSLGVGSLEALKPEGIRPSGRVVDDVEALLQALAAWQGARRIAQQLPAARLLQQAHKWLDAERPRRLAERNLMSHDGAIDKLAAALESDRRDALVAALRQRWKAALVDEFQDTDTAQWKIVEALFAGTALIVVGDPKQAIYGFRGGDVHAWWQALADAKRADADGVATLQLTRSYRAGAGLCAAINALFSQHGHDEPAAFIEPIAHPDLEPAESVKRCAVLRSGQSMRALQLWWLDPEKIDHAAGKLPSKGRAEPAIERACVAWIAGLLDDPDAVLREGDGSIARLRAKHFAVLVDSNKQALSMQAALGRAGIAASCNLKSSVYASDEAADLSLLLEAAAAPDDIRRARAAHASMLVGWDATAIVGTMGDDARQAALLECVAGWSASLRRHGPSPWLHGLLHDAAPRLLALPDGQRRVANYLQLGELLQDLHATSFGTADLAARFARARVESSDNADAERLRLDTDADAVTVSTVHAAKGLEYDVVLVPYAALGKAPRQPTVPLHWYHDGANVGHVAIGKGANEAIIARALREAAAEDVRKLYVAVTRASALCVIPYGPTQATPYSALFHLLHAAGRAEPLPDDAAGHYLALEELRARARDAAEIVDELPRDIRKARAAPVEAMQELHARPFDGSRLERDWSVWSFSRLVRGSGHGGDPLPGAGDGADVDATPHVAGLVGARFGTAVHAVFERTRFDAWRAARGTPASERALVETSLRGEGLPPRGTTMADAVDFTGACVRNALGAELPCGARLCDVDESQRKAEIEFHFPLAPAATDALHRLLRDHEYLRGRERFDTPSLRGLLTGKIDLVFRHAGRFHIIDWKTNVCAAYDEATLREAIDRHDYDLQWLIYTLALHRWLRQRLPDYAYERHVGDVYYLFVRGMHDGGGIFRDRPRAGLVEAMDRLFRNGTTT